MDLKHNRSVKLSDGHSMPRLGFGTIVPRDVSELQGTWRLSVNCFAVLVSRYKPYMLQCG